MTFTRRSYLPEPLLDGEAATMENGRSQQMLTERATRIDTLIEKYSFLSVSAAEKQVQAPAPKVKVVLLTGTTGNLGSDLLAALLCDPTVAKVYALNRKSKSGTSRERIGDQFSEKNLPEDMLDSPRVVLLEGDLGNAKLGLTDAQYEEVRRGVTIIVHNAWPVGYIQPLSRFEPSLLGLHNLLILGRALPKEKNPRFVFISSTASAFLWRVYEKEQPIPEELLSNHGVAIGLGYAESKYIGEHIVARSGLNATSLRVTQLCGRTSDGAWPISEWLPMMVKLIQELKSVPAVMITKRISWLPTDAAADIIRDIALSPLELPPMLNLAHPRPSGWHALHPLFRHLIWKQHESSKVIHTLEWTKLVEKEVKERMGPGAAKFINRLFGLLAIIVPFNPVFDDNIVEDFPASVASTVKAQEISPTLRNLPELTIKDFERWAQYWISVGFIEPRPAEREAKL